MATATASLNIYVAPEDGWKEVVAPSSTINFIDVRPFPFNHGVYLYIGASKPTELFEPTGMKLDSACFKMNVATSSVGVWVRCLTPAWGGGSNADGQKQRVDVIVTTA
jgi:hypothetical protein